MVGATEIYGSRIFSCRAVLRQCELPGKGHDRPESFCCCRSRRLRRIHMVVAGRPATTSHYGELQLVRFSAAGACCWPPADHGPLIEQRP